jgi:hypothetical protein
MVYNKEYAREYHRRPEVKKRRQEYQREYYQRPEIKERRNKYLREYSRRPVVRERMKKNWEKYTPCKVFIKRHHVEMQNDPERLTTDFLINITGCECKREKI